MEDSNNFSYTVCRNGAVNVLNPQHEPPHIYTVQLVGRFPRSCSCPDHQYRGRQCKHMRAVTSNPLVRSFAFAIGAANR